MFCIQSREHQPFHTDDTQNPDHHLAIFSPFPPTFTPLKVLQSLIKVKTQEKTVDLYKHAKLTRHSFICLFCI